jgi:hypothetical protein
VRNLDLPTGILIEKTQSSIEFLKDPFFIENGINAKRYQAKILIPRREYAPGESNY